MQGIQGTPESHRIRKYGGTPMRVSGYVFTDDWNRESITPTGYPTLYTNAETGGSGSSGINSIINRCSLTTDSTGAGDDQDMRTSGLRIDRNYPSTMTGLLPDHTTSTVQIDLPFILGATTDIEGFIGIHSGVAALTALPTTARHLGVYWDKSAGNNFMLSSSDGTTQTTVDTTTAFSTALFNLRIIWTAEDAATLQLYTAAGAASGTGATVTAFNGSSAASHEIHWFVQTETNAGKSLQIYPWRIAWA